MLTLSRSTNLRFMHLVAVMIAIFVLLAISNAAHAYKEVAVNCTPPATRTDDSTFTSAMLGGYDYGIKETGKNYVELAADKPAPCSYVVAIPANTCFKAGTIFYASVFDTLGVRSDPGASAPLTADACNTLPKPKPPAVTATPR